MKIKGKQISEHTITENNLILSKLSINTMLSGDTVNISGGTSIYGNLVVSGGTVVSTNLSGNNTGDDWEDIILPYNYGNLYNWYTLNDIRGIAPIGWHVATDTEWLTLISYLGGTSVAGGKLKSTRTTIQPRWDSPNTGADNQTLFYALGCGLRMQTGLFFGLNQYSVFLNPANIGTTTNSYQLIYNGNDFQKYAGSYKRTGASVRCVKDSSIYTPNEIVTGVDGNKYTTTQIGTQVWLTQNLKTTKYNDGSSIPNVTGNTEWDSLTTGAYCTYNNLPLSNYEDPTFGYGTGVIQPIDGKQVIASSFIKSGGTSTEFLMANGSLNNNIYTTTGVTATKLDKNSLITSGTSMKITYDTKGLVLSGQTAVIDDLFDVDLTVPAVRDQVLKFNGTTWVATAYNTSFALSISSFSTGQSSPQLIGTGTWKTTGSLSFTIGYTNPPPSSANIVLTSTGGNAWVSPLTLISPFTGGTSSGNTLYPSRDGIFTFTLTAMDGSTPRTSTSTVTFNNYIYWGQLSKFSGFTSGEITGLTYELSSSPVTTKSLTSTSGQYLIFAYPSSYTDIHTTGFLYNSVTCPFTKYTVSVTNTAGFIEDYKVYSSNNPNLGNSSLITNTSSNLIGHLYYGTSNLMIGLTQTEIKTLTGLTTTITNSYVGQKTITATVGQYIVLSFPTRLGIPTFKVGGFQFSLNDPYIIPITNVNGYTENYYVWTSEVAGLGLTVIDIT